MIAGGKKLVNHLLLWFIKCSFLVNEVQHNVWLKHGFVNGCQLIHKANTHLFLQPAECLALCGYAEHLVVVVLGTQLMKHFENTISFRFCLGKLAIKGPSLEFYCFHWLQSGFLGSIIWCSTFPWNKNWVVKNCVLQGSAWSHHLFGVAISESGLLSLYLLNLPGLNQNHLVVSFT